MGKWEKWIIVAQWIMGTVPVIHFFYLFVSALAHFLNLYNISFFFLFYFVIISDER